MPVGRGCVAGYRENTFTLTVWMSHQLPYVVRHYLAKHLRLAETDVRVIIPHTGGGFGPPFERDPERVRTDVLHGYVSRDAAARAYGVALDEDLAVDEAATARLRAAGPRSS